MCQSFSRCLVGSVLNRRQFGTHTMQELVNELWHTLAPVRVIGRHDNLYLFQFSSEVDLNHAFSRVPWSMRGGLLVLDFWQPSMALAVTRFYITALWVQFHNQPLEYFCEEAGRRLGSLLGDVIQVCWACGLIGHTLPQCDKSREEATSIVDRHLRDICDRFGVTVRANVNFPLYNSSIRAYAQNDRRRNTHMWVPRNSHSQVTRVVEGTQVENADGGLHELQRQRARDEDRNGGLNLSHFRGVNDSRAMGRVHNRFLEDEEQVSVGWNNFDEFIVAWELAWEWGLQEEDQRDSLSNRPSPPPPTLVEALSGDRSVVMEERDRMGSSGALMVLEENSGMDIKVLEAIAWLEWINDHNFPTPEEADAWWCEWEPALLRGGVNAGRWVVGEGDYSGVMEFDEGNEGERDGVGRDDRDSENSEVAVICEGLLRLEIFSDTKKDGKTLRVEEPNQVGDGLDEENGTMSISSRGRERE
ncbi:hypothetical protein Vadar_011168 [Vaccinium darrowii]|uniref:Uncharacterized protein n=1 Tax=Vaccinium darrowii TaxID=229202 RepID=A0ACB7YKQ7_9ERIC|nr:hypothetical protein Vadar_011168 [Vaccinium darrowii]